MIKLDTLVLIDLFNTDGMSKKYDTPQHKEAYKNMAMYIEGLRIITGITDVVFAAYGSGHELYPTNTDYIFKDNALFPRDSITRHTVYDIEDKPELFENKGILVAGVSFYTCFRQRNTGIFNLLESELPRDVWSAPEITGYYGAQGSTIDSVFEETKTHLQLITATKQDFRSDPNLKWRKVELDDTHSIFKAEK